MYLNDVERFTKLLQDKKRDKIIKMMDEMHDKSRYNSFDRKKQADIKEFINTLKHAGKQKTHIVRGKV